MLSHIRTYLVTLSSTFLAGPHAGCGPEEILERTGPSSGPCPFGLYPHSHTEPQYEGFCFTNQYVEKFIHSFFSMEDWLLISSLACVKGVGRGWGGVPAAQRGRQHAARNRWDGGPSSPALLLAFNCLRCCCIIMMTGPYHKNEEVCTVHGSLLAVRSSLACKY